MLQEGHSAILSTFIKLPFVMKIFVLSIFEWPFYTGFTVYTRKKPLNGNVGVSNEGRDLYFGLDLYLHPNFVYTSRKVSDVPAHLHSLP